MSNELIISSIGYAIFFSCCCYFLHTYRYDLNAFYKGRYLLYQELLIITINTETSIILSYRTTREINKIASYAFLISHSAFFITYFLFVYRMIILNKIEFGKFRSGEYEDMFKKLKSSWNIKITIIFTVVVSSPSLTIFALYSNGHFLDCIKSSLTDPKLQAFYFYYYSIGFLEYFSYCYLFYYAIKEKFRLTIKIDLFMNLLIWSSYYTSIFTAPVFEHYSICLPLRSISLQMTIIVSFLIRKKFIKIPDPPLYHEPYIFLYEHRMLYTALHSFLETIDDKKYLSYLELGLYISMYRFQHKHYHLISINNSCIALGLPQFDDIQFINTEIFIKNQIESIFSDFFSSKFYQKLSDKLIYHSKALYL